MLHKSFKPAKCKTSLKLASSRIKLLKNKKDAQVKQLKRELASLLESGQEQTARIRVEHVVREEKTIAAYNLIEIYCELIVARLPMIESQKSCPIDLKEAISSVIFASPRCADIPELADVRKQITAKYGKEFVSAAVELRPECGVGRLLVEKLSAKAPDGPTKIKILSEIAEEHNIKWDPKAFGEKDLKPHIEFLGGPTTFSQASYEMPDPPNVQRTSNDRFPPQPNDSPNVPQNYYDNKSMPTSPSRSEAGPSENRTDGIEFRQSYSRGSDTSNFGRQNWNMEFKDATAAAQAAAESAERASMAARAAAELSGRGNFTRQHSTESQKSCDNCSSDKNPQRYSSSTLRDDHLAKVPEDRNSRMQYDKFRSEEEENQSRLSTQRINRDDVKSSSMSGQSPSFKSSTGFVDEHQTSVNKLEMAGRFSRKNQYDLDQSGSFGEVNTKKQPSFKSSTGFVDEHQTSVNKLEMAGRFSRKNQYDLDQSGSFGEVNTKKQPSEPGVEFFNKEHDDEKSENFHYSEDISASRQPSRVSSRSHPSTFVDDHVPSNEMHSNIDNPFADDNGLDVEENTRTTISHQSESVFFDDSGSDDDQYKFDMVSEHKEHEFEHGISSPVGKSPFLNTSIHSLGQSTDEIQKSSSQTYNSSVFSTNVASSDFPSTLDNLPAMAFDDSDGPSSGSEGEQDNSHLVGFRDQGTVAYEQNIKSRDSEQPQAENRQFSSLFTDKPETMFDRDDGTIRQSSLGNSRNDNRGSFNNLGDGGVSRGYDVMDDVLPKDAELLTESSLEGDNQLNFGTLTGGLRNKGFKRPSAGIASVSKPSTESTSSTVERSNSTVKASISNRDVSQKQDNWNLSEDEKKVQATYNDDSGNELSQQTFNSNEKPYYGTSGLDEESKRPTPRTSIKYFDGDSEEDIPKQTSSSSVRQTSGISRRTKATPVNSRRNSSSRPTALSQTPVTPDYGMERKTSSVSSYTTETLPKQVSEKKSPDLSGNSERPEFQAQSVFESNRESSRPSVRQQVVEESEKKTPDGSRSSEWPEFQAQSVFEPPLGSSRPSVRQQVVAESKKSTREEYLKPYVRQQVVAEPTKSAREEYLKPSVRQQVVAEPKKSAREEYLKPSVREQPSRPSAKTTTYDKTETSKTTSSSSGGNPSEEKATHVHPKLPDYDSFAAHFQSLKQNRK